MDVQKKLDEITATVANARSMPMSASCVVNRAELLAMLRELSEALPDSLSQAQELLGDREQMVAEARAEAQRIIESAHAERGSLISDTQIARQSQDEAERILAEARREADEIRAEADDYVDSKLANFEVVLTKTIGSVDRGREKLLGRDPYAGDDQGYAEDDPDAPERSSDPETLRRRADEYVDAKLGAFEAVLTKTLEAVGRGRLKLTGHNPIDDLAAHIAAQDAVDDGPDAGGHRQQSDAEYLAGLAAPAAPEQADLSQYGYEAPAAQPAQDGYGYPQQPGYDYQQDAYAQQGAYAPDPYGAQPGYPQQEAAGYDYGGPVYEQQQYGAEIPYQQGGHQDQGHGYGQQQPAALDETSFFDTGMIDLARLRELEQGR
ncbi:ATP synthase F0 subunit B [Streptomyces sp. HPF1205]|uniref:ATP synthase F0 subunit B n=1 Tax=Streptomyces sp. HPF1205 TaxID=2873262 RepID=UPI001CECBD99|nr:ATP synthase F0 subunit B [Streptomyces sp. HPF1205]